MTNAPGATARLGITIDYAADFTAAAAEVTEAERVGVDLVSVAEAYSFDAVSRLGYLAAVTSTMTIASGILPLFSRTPTMLAMTAAGLDDLSGGRFELGLGASGPQVIEGFHGVPYTRPLSRMRETIDICRSVWRREPVIHDGRDYQVPLPADQGTGLGKPLKIINRLVRDRIPIAVAALAPKGVAQAAEVADGWLPLFYYPEKAADAWGEPLAEGAALRSPDLAPLDVQAGLPLLVGDDGSPEVEAALAEHRAHLALYVGGMGAKGANFYNDLAVRYGWVDEAARVQELYLSGEKAAAIAALPEELVLGTCLIGSESHLRARVSALLASGVTTIYAQSLGATPDARLSSLEALRGILDAP